MGASLAEPRLARLRYLAVLTGAGAGVATINQAFVPLPFKLAYPFVQDALFATCVIYFLLSVAGHKIDPGESHQIRVAAPDGKPAARSIFLRPYEQDFTILIFLQTIASSLFVVTLLLLTPLIAFAQLSLLTKTLTAGSLLALALLWTWALSSMWRPLIFLGSWIVGVAILEVPFTQIAEIWSSHQDIVTRTMNSSIALLLSIVSFWFGWRVLSDGWHLARISGKNRDLLTIAEPGATGPLQIIALSLGIHPICSWLAALWRRLVCRILFLLAGIARGFTIFAAIVASAMFTRVGIIALLVIPGIGAAITAGFRNAARRFARTSVEALARFDARPPVLFLRSFRDDQVRLARWTGRGRFRDLMSLGEPAPTVDHILLDEATTLGPIVALGLPGQPPPFGVPRTYVNDLEWQNAVASLAKRSEAIVVAVDETAGVIWELTYIRDAGYSGKTLCLLPPQLASPEQVSRVLGHVSAAYKDHASMSILSEQSAGQCIGWYHLSEGPIALLLSPKPNKASYVCALRMFCQHHASEREFIGWRAELEASRQKWQETSAGKNKALLSGSTLDRARYWLAGREDEVPENDRHFIDLSNIKRAARNRVLQRIAFFGMLLFVGIVASYAVRSNRDYLAALSITVAERIGETIWPIILTAEMERALKPRDAFRECASCPEMVVLPPGEFMMGSPSTEAGHDADEDPQHKVAIEYAFAVSRFEATFDEWDACMTAAECVAAVDQGWGRGKRPVINVSWNEIQQYLSWLSKRTGKPYRLLSEAEWEYAARAGSQTAYSWGDQIGVMNANCKGCGWFDPNSGLQNGPGGKTATVGAFAPNAFGVFDMHGNVWEWVQDCYRMNYVRAPTNGSAVTSPYCANRVIRGGSWETNPQALRAANRVEASVRGHGNGLGFRVARTLSR